MNKETKNIIISTIQGEKHLGSNLKMQCIKYIDSMEQALIDIRKIFTECKMLMPHEFDWEEQADNILQIINKVLGGSDER